MKTGDLVKFGYVNGHTRKINGRVALYLGEYFFKRSDCFIIENHRVLMAGDGQISIIDKGLLRHMRVINECR